MILTAAATGVTEFKPAVPKYFIVKSFESEGSSKNVAGFVKENLAKGWILKSIAAANYSQNYSTWIVVMEKY